VVEKHLWNKFRGAAEFPYWGMAKESAMYMFTPQRTCKRRNEL